MAEIALIKMLESYIKYAEEDDGAYDAADDAGFLPEDAPRTIDAITTLTQRNEALENGLASIKGIAEYPPQDRAILEICNEPLQTGRDEG